MVIHLDHNRALITVDRFIVCSLLVLFLLMMLSGYMHGGAFIDILPSSQDWAFWAHMELAIPTMAFFTVHVCIRLRFFLLRRRMKEDLLVNLLPVLVGLSLFLPVLYLRFFFQPN
jgi:thiosulfate reductase cytochrome b subunit